MKPLNRGDNPDTADTSGETLGFVVATAALLHASNLQLKLTKRFIEQLLGCKLSCPLSPFSQTLQQNVFLELVRNGVPVDGCFQARGRGMGYPQLLMVPRHHACSLCIQRLGWCGVEGVETSTSAAPPHVGLPVCARQLTPYFC